MRILILIIILFTNHLFSQNLPLIDSRDHCVLVSAEVQSNPAQIRLHWTPNRMATEYRIYKKLVTEPSFPSSVALANLDAEATEFIDTDVIPGVNYEYQIVATSVGGLPAKDSEGNDITAAVNFIAFGYASAGIELNEPDDYGIVLLLIDETIIESLEAEINRLVDDLTLEGYSVFIEEVKRTEQFNKDNVIATKRIITDLYELYLNDLKSVFILGRAAVPYSGLTAPDGHSPDHVGAWPADMYYGEMQDLYWTDINVNNTGASREATKNIPGDGKFDVTVLPSAAKIDIAVGRVDLYNMPAFEKSEIELLRNYLDQNHKYRTNELAIERRGLIEDTGFPAYRLYEGFSASGWRNFGAFFGGENVSKQDFLAMLKDENYMWVYGTGPGSYKSAGQIATTSDYAANEVKGLFSMLFGSYFGDWDVADNLLRAPLANDYPALTNAWAARPQWFMHHLTSGHSMGYVTKLTQNNNPGTGYLSNVLYLPPQYPNGVHYSTGYREIHVALMGDPTLRLEMGFVHSPENVAGTVIKNGAEITWEVPPIDGIYHFNIYRRTENDPVFRKINEQPISDNFFTDNEGFEGSVEYLIKTAQLHYSNTASIFKESRGVLLELLNTNVESNISNNISVVPNPAIEFCDIKVETTNDNEFRIEIYDLGGNLIYDFGNRYLASGLHSFRWNLNNINNYSVVTGTYIFKLISNDEVKVAKINVVK